MSSRWFLPVAAALGARLVFSVLSGWHEPRLFPDSVDYFEIAAQPFSWQHLFYAKPLLVPSLFRLLDAHAEAITLFQRELAFWSWSLLAVALYVSAKNRWAAAGGLVVAYSFLISPLRVGWTGTVLSESVNDSLMALIAALGMFLTVAVARLDGPRRRLVCGALVGGLATVLVAWVLARDTNAVAVIVGVPAAAGLWGVRRRADRPWAILAATGAIAIAGFALWTTQVTPRHPTGLTVNTGWDVTATARARLPVFNNLFNRILPDPEARAYFHEHGLPMIPELMTLQVPPGGAEWEWDRRVLTDPAFGPARAWLAEHGARVYALWLIRDPAARISELGGAVFRILAPDDLSLYMPQGWYSIPPTITTVRAVVLLLLLAAPVLAWRARRSPVVAVGVCLAVSGAASAIAAFYGDGIEISRHCYGAGQQVVLGLMMVVVGWAE